MNGKVATVSRSATHTFGRQIEDGIGLLAECGFERDAHKGELVNHRSRVAHDPIRPNLRQVHQLKCASS